MKAEKKIDDYGIAYWIIVDGSGTPLNGGQRYESEAAVRAAIEVLQAHSDPGSGTKTNRPKM